MTTSNLTFRVENELRKNFAAYAKSQDRTTAQMLRELMRSCVAGQQSFEQWMTNKVSSRLAEYQSGAKVLTAEEADDEFDAFEKKLKDKIKAEEKK
jgi:predicted transcriptional regulator